MKHKIITMGLLSGLLGFIGVVTARQIIKLQDRIVVFRVLTPMTYYS
jgi:hypothetical protein